MSWYIQAIKNYCNFSGRARRTEYWMFALISAVIVFVLGIIDGIIGIKLLTSLYSLFILIPELSLVQYYFSCDSNGFCYLADRK